MRTSRYSPRLFTVAAVAAAGLALSGCGSDSSGKQDEGKASEKPAPTADAQEPTGEPGELDGIWSTSAMDAAKGGKQEVITLAKGQAVLVAGKTMCQGKAVEAGKSVTVAFTCPDGSTDYAKGTVTPAGADKVDVAWASGEKVTMERKAAAADVPSTLPSAVPEEGS